MAPPPLAAPQLRSADPPGRGYTCLGNRLLDEWAHGEPHGVSEASSRVAAACGGISRQLVTAWRNENKRVAPKHWTAIAGVTGIAVEVWETWELLTAEEPTPASEERPAPAKVALNSTREELDSTIQQIDTALRGGVTDGQRVQLLGKRASALMSRARLEERQAIADHPDFAPLVEDLVLAVRDALGPDAPDGIEARIADELERRQVARATSADRRAA